MTCLGGFIMNEMVMKVKLNYSRIVFHLLPSPSSLLFKVGHPLSKNCFCELTNSVNYHPQPQVPYKDLVELFRYVNDLPPFRCFVMRGNTVNCCCCQYRCDIRFNQSV